MRYLLLFGLFAAVAFWLRAQFGREKPVERIKPALAKPPVPMLLCSHCGVHMPGQEAVSGKLGSYCSAAHLQLAED